ncbi:MAG TPA: hypothetical protein VEM15_04180 [Thermodesulfobacteriota bacterium]|nr:hypothetical protein [Thermodesulfobacteriota bacterium]
MRRHIGMLLCFAWMGMMVSACATPGTAQKPYRFSQQGTIIWQDEFEFKPPPSNWRVIQVEVGGEFGFGFLKVDSGPAPSQSMFVYDEEPFGCSTEPGERGREFFRRYLWSTAMIADMQILEKKNVNVLGGEGLAVVAEAKDPVKKEKVKSKVVFGKRGDRVVAFYLTQWRPMDGTYDPSAFEVFDRFWESFRFLKKSFYQTLVEDP